MIDALLLRGTKTKDTLFYRCFGLELRQAKREVWEQQKTLFSLCYYYTFLKRIIESKFKGKIEVERVDGGKKKNRWRSLLSAWSHFL